MNLTEFKLSSGHSPSIHKKDPLTEKRITKKQRQRGRFIKGPIPLSWIHKASILPGKALHVGMLIWHLVGLENSKTVKVKPTLCTQSGISRHSKYRALKALAASGLIRIERSHRGEGATISLLIPSEEPAHA